MDAAQQPLGFIFYAANTIMPTPSQKINKIEYTVFCLKKLHTK
jgi:hypothetical protein